MRSRFAPPDTLALELVVQYNDRVMDNASTKSSLGLATACGAGSTLSEIIRRIVSAIDPEKIILFGSRARGDARPDSDYDLLIIKDTTHRTLGLERTAYRAMKGLTTGVDILVETPDRVRRLSSRTGNVIGDAVREGALVYERADRS